MNCKTNQFTGFCMTGRFVVNVVKYLISCALLLITKLETLIIKYKTTFCFAGQTCRNSKKLMFNSFLLVLKFPELKSNKILLFPWQLYESNSKKILLLRTYNTGFCLIISQLPPTLFSIFKTNKTKL